MSEELKQLDLRIAKIESMLEAVTSRSKVTEITAEELKTYQKVRDAIAFDPDTVCGINECFKCVTTICRVCAVTAICRVCRVCDVECICGPCNLGGMGGRFGSLGQ